MMLKFVTTTLLLDWLNEFDVRPELHCRLLPKGLGFTLLWVVQIHSIYNFDPPPRI